MDYIQQVTVASADGSKTMSLCVGDVESSKLSSIFGFDPTSPIWLVRQDGNLVVFPAQPGGKFIVQSGKKYTVHGPSNDGTNPTTNTAVTPFGSYMATTPLMQPPSSVTATPTNRSRKWRKTIALVSLSGTASNQPSSSKAIIANTVKPKVISHIIVNLDHSNCTVTAVAELVKQQVGVDVILMDSKCYILFNNASTTGIDFWKSTRKILAASKQNYEKAYGKAPSINAAFDLSNEQTEESTPEGPPSPKRVKLSDIEDAASLVTQINAISLMVQNMKAFEELLQMFSQLLQCPICKETVTNPILAPCCGSIAGCQLCIDLWLLERNSCPLCAISDRIKNEKIRLHGFDAAIMQVKCMEALKDNSCISSDPVPSPPASTVGSLEDFELT